MNDRIYELTPRQVQVIRLVGKGQTNREIALTLGLEEATVKTHVTLIIRKMKARNRAHIVALFTQWGGEL
jgi:DNA-binding NarL/FixJ family response regulator